MRFCLHIAWLCTRIRFVCMFGWFWVFPLCCWRIFGLFNRKMSVVIFWHVLFWHFAQCFDMCCAQLFVCLVAFFFAFWLFMCNYLLAIFVAMVLPSHFGFFFPKYSLFCFLLFCRFFSVPLPRCFVFLAAQFASFCALGYFWVLCHANVFFLRCCSFFCCLVFFSFV